MTTVRLATPSDFPQLARAQMRAFTDDPLISWMVVPEDFERRATLLFDCLLRVSLDNQSLYTTDDCVCAASWASPGHWEFTDEQLATMAEPFLEATGDRADRAMGSLIALAEAHPQEPHWYLEVLGTHPDWQRLGMASAVIRPILDRCDADALPAYLETQKEINVPFYRGHGFEVQRTLQLADGGPNMWLMWREPQ